MILQGFFFVLGGAGVPERGISTACNGKNRTLSCFIIVILPALLISLTLLSPVMAVMQCII